jgi:hypothetical protein
MENENRKEAIKYLGDRWPKTFSYQPPFEDAPEGSLVEFFIYLIEDLLRQKKNLEQLLEMRDRNG